VDIVFKSIVGHTRRKRNLEAHLGELECPTSFVISWRGLDSSAPLIPDPRRGKARGIKFVALIS
jgi:hypothetical protein